MISIRILNLIFVLAGFTSLMWAFAHQIKCLKLKFTGPRMAKFYFLIAALGFTCYEIWNLRFESGNTVMIWNFWAILLAYLLTKYHPFKTETNEDLQRIRNHHHS